MEGKWIKVVASQCGCQLERFVFTLLTSFEGRIGDGLGIKEGK